MKCRIMRTIRDRCSFHTFEVERSTANLAVTILQIRSVQFTRVMIDEDADGYLDALMIRIFGRLEVLANILMGINLNTAAVSG